RRSAHLRRPIVRHQREGQDPTVSIEHIPGQRAGNRESSGLGAHPARALPVLLHITGAERTGRARDGQRVQQRGEPGVLGVGGAAAGRGGRGRRPGRAGGGGRRDLPARGRGGGEDVVEQARGQPVVGGQDRKSTRL